MHRIRLMNTLLVSDPEELSSQINTGGWGDPDPDGDDDIID